MTLIGFSVLKTFGISLLAFGGAIVWAPHLIAFLHRHKLWKKSARAKAISGEDAVVFNALHKERETSVPRMGGLLIFGTVVAITLLFYLLSVLFPQAWISQFNFLSRGTILPLFVFTIASLFGLLDDILVVSGLGKYIGGGISFTKRLTFVAILGLIAGLWLYTTSHTGTLTIPFFGEYAFGFWYVILCIIAMVGTWSGGIIDGIDGLSGGAFATLFGSFAMISFMQGKTDLATLCAVITATILAFLWFNISPARFYMTEVGVLGLTTTITIIAFMTDAVFVLPIIAGLLVMEVGSVIIQLLSKKFRGKKIFLSTPIHHHFEAIGWPAHNVTMRFWVMGVIFAMIGIMIHYIG